MKAALRVLIPGKSLLFEDPLRVLRATTPQEARSALAQAQDALAAGYWIAGVLSYELGYQFTQLPTPAGNLLTLGMYRTPKKPQPHLARKYGISLPAVRTTFEAYAHNLTHAHHEIFDGRVYQVNYTVPSDATFSGDVLSLFYALVSQSAARYAAYVEDGNSCILSISPELFLKIDGNSVLSAPMKGTAPLDQPQQLDDEKNRAEHLMIVDLLRNDLQRVCENVRVRNLFAVEEYPTLLTMTSQIEGRLRTRDFPHLLEATFPCGSITGAPKRAAMQWIASRERWPRGAYTGSIGYLSPQWKGCWNVAIRTLQLDRQSGDVRIDTGGGIVFDSEARTEWEELLLKRRFVDAIAAPALIASSPAS